MRTDIIADLKSLYIIHRKKIHPFLKSKLLIQLCDDYFIRQMSYQRMAKKRNSTELIIKHLMIKACGKIIRNQHLIKNYV